MNTIALICSVSIIMVVFIISNVNVSWADSLRIHDIMIKNETREGYLLRSNFDDTIVVSFTFNSEFIEMVETKTWSKGEPELIFDIKPIKVGKTTIIAEYGLERHTANIEIIEKDEDDKENVLPSSDNLFIPEHILQPGDYKGMIIREDASQDLEVKLVSNTDILKVPDTITIPAGDNHYIFDITTHGIGEAVVIAKTGETFWKTGTTIHDSISNNYTIQLYGPTNTRSTGIQVAVYLIDDFKNPVYVEESTEIFLVASNMEAPTSVIIPKGRAHQFFTASINGDSSITAFTDKSISEKLEIDYEPTQNDVMLDLSSDEVPTNSIGYIFGWLTVNDEIHRPSVPVTGTIKASGYRIVSVGDSPSISDSFTNEAKITIQDGIFYTKFFTHDEGSATISLSVPGYGVATKDISVKKSAADEWGERWSPPEGTQIDYLNHPNVISTKVIPDISDGESYLVVSFQKNIDIVRDLNCKDEDDDEEVDSTDDTDNTDDNDSTNSTEKIIGCDSTINGDYPAVGLDNTQYHITSQSLVHDINHKFISGAIKTSAFIVPISTNIHESHDIEVSGSSISPSTSTIRVLPPKDYSFHITTLPHVTGDNYPVFLLSVTDGDTIINPVREFGHLEVKLLSDQVEFEKDEIVLNKPTTIIYGKSNVKFPTMSAIAINKDIVKTVIDEPIDDLTAKILAPDIPVHYGEDFVMYAFLMAGDKPVSDISHLLESDCQGEDSLYRCFNDSLFYIFRESLDLHNATIKTFLNQFDEDDIQINFGSRVINIGSEFAITTRIADDVNIDVRTGIPHEIRDGNIILQPENPGTYDVVIDFTKDGYVSTQRQRDYVVNNDVTVNIRTYNHLGTTLLSTGFITNDKIAENVETPARITMEPGPINIEFPPDIQREDFAYTFVRAEVSDGSTYISSAFDYEVTQSVTIDAIYKPTISVLVSGGQGGGTFNVGDTTRLFAEDREVVFFLIKDVFDRWSSLPAGYDIYSNPVTITIQDSFSTEATYKTDYSGLILMIIVGIIVLFVLIKRNSIIGGIKR